MNSTSEEQRQNDEDAAAVFDKLKVIGRKYGRVIMTAVIRAELNVDEIDAGMEAVLADTREFLETNGICDNDVEVALSVVRAAIIAEGKAIAVMLPDSVGGLH